NPAGGPPRAAAGREVLTTTGWPVDGAPLKMRRLYQQFTAPRNHAKGGISRLRVLNRAVATKGSHQPQGCSANRARAKRWRGGYGAGGARLAGAAESSDSGPWSSRRRLGPPERLGSAEGRGRRIPSSSSSGLGMTTRCAGPTGAGV